MELIAIDLIKICKSHTANCKASLKDIKNTETNEQIKINSFFIVGRHYSVYIGLQNSRGLFGGSWQILKSIYKFKESRMGKTIGKNNSGRASIAQFQEYHKGTMIKTVWYWHEDT